MTSPTEVQGALGRQAADGKRCFDAGGVREGDLVVMTQLVRLICAAPQARVHFEGHGRSAPEDPYQQELRRID